MASKLPEILDRTAELLAGIPGVKQVYRILGGDPLPDEDDADLPAVYMRLLADTIEDIRSDKAKVAAQIAIELFFVPDDSSAVDSQAVAWAWEIRKAFFSADPTAYEALLRANPAQGIETQGASYQYPQQQGGIASVRHPITLRCVENY